MPNFNPLDINHALILATYLITFLGVVFGVVSALTGLVVSSRRKEIAEFKESINKQVADFEKERKEFRNQLVGSLVTIKHLTYVQQICGEYLECITKAELADSLQPLIEYHELQSNLTRMISHDDSEDIAWDLNYISSLIGIEDKLDKSLIDYLFQLWSDGFFKSNSAQAYFESWYIDTFGRDAVSLPDLGNISRP